MKRHSEFSPSSFERRVYCPASWAAERYAKNEDTKESLMGTDYHSKVAGCFKTGKKSGDWMVDKCFDVAANVSTELGLLKDKTTKTYIEKEFSYENNGETVNFGTIDFACVGKDKALVVDWKFGFEEVAEAEDNWQLRWYAFFIVNSYDVKEVVTIIFNPRIGQFTRATYTREWLTHDFIPAFTQVIDTCKKETEHYMCGSHCKYCKGRMACPAFKECADRYMLMSDKQDLTLWTDEKLVAYFEKIGIVKQVIDNVSTELKRRAKESGHCGKYEVKEQSAGFEVTDTKGVISVLEKEGLTIDEILECCRITMTPVFDKMYQINREMHKNLTKTQSRDETVAKLEGLITSKKLVEKVVEIK